MPVTNTIDIFSTYTMMAVLEQITPETFFFKDRYFPTGEGDRKSTRLNSSHR